jgi:hypothetical protein
MKATPNGGNQPSEAYHLFSFADGEGAMERQARAMEYMAMYLGQIAEGIAALTGSTAMLANLAAQREQRFQQERRKAGKR